MSTPNQDEVEGKFENVKGKVKEGVGDLTGNRDLEAEGQADQAEGKTRKVGEKSNGESATRLMPSVMQLAIPAKI